MRKKILAVVIFCFILGFIYSDNFKTSGYFKSFTLFMPDSSYSSQSEGRLNQMLRINLKYDIKNNLNFNFSYEIQPTIRSNNLYPDSKNYQRFRIDDINRRLFPEEKDEIGSMVVNQNLDRLFFSFYLPFADLYAGRQAISWGSGHIINPTDLFLSYSFDELDKEEKVGVDALRLRIPFGMMSEIDLGAVFGEKMKKSSSAYYTRLKFYKYKADFFFLFMYFKEHFLYGFDFTKAIKGAGVWAEVAYVDNSTSNGKASLHDNYFRATAGCDYYFSNNTYIVLEYHLNTIGEDTPARYKLLHEKEAYRDGNVYLMGRNYINFIYNYQITGLINNNNMVLYNVSDNSLCINPGVEYNISQNIYIKGGAFVYVDPFESKDKKEFEYYDNFIYFSFQVYF